MQVGTYTALLVEGALNMDVREKLVEIIQNSVGGCARHWAEVIADGLIAHGVTVQEWISVKEQLPQENEPEGALCEDVQVLLNNGKVSVGWCNRRTKLWYHMDYGEDYFTSNDYDHTPVVAWMPLSEPPKGE